MKYISILSFSLALACPLIFVWTSGSVLLVVFLFILGIFSLRRHYRNLAHQSSEQALAGNVDWQRYDRKPNETDIAISKIEPFVKYGIPMVVVVIAIIGMRAQALILSILYFINMWLNHSNKKPS